MIPYACLQKLLENGLAYHILVCVCLLSKNLNALPKPSNDAIGI